MCATLIKNILNVATLIKNTLNAVDILYNNAIEQIYVVYYYCVNIKQIKCYEMVY